MRHGPPDALERVEGYVWCDWYGEIHEDIEDPMNEGPRETAYQPEGEGWVTRTDYKDWKGTLRYFVCPGLHRPMWMLALQPWPPDTRVSGKRRGNHEVVARTDKTR